MKTKITSLTPLIVAALHFNEMMGFDDIVDPNEIDLDELGEEWEQYSPEPFDQEFIEDIASGVKDGDIIPIILDEDMDGYRVGGDDIVYYVDMVVDHTKKGHVVLTDYSDGTRVTIIAVKP